MMPPSSKLFPAASVAVGLAGRLAQSALTIQQSLTKSLLLTRSNLVPHPSIRNHFLPLSLSLPSSSHFHPVKMKGGIRTAESTWPPSSTSLLPSSSISGALLSDAFSAILETRLIIVQQCVCALACVRYQVFIRTVHVTQFFFRCCYQTIQFRCARLWPKCETTYKSILYLIQGFLFTIDERCGRKDA